ncbi:hypothetical protein [Streptomyces sp. NPDC047097]|uniref:hypothetical protein n=1 Tax=Streptomyces sp. NPDC047097 TaxID=3155260 RepID=UPI0033F66EC8
MRIRVWRDAEGGHWVEDGFDYDGVAEVPAYRMFPATRDESTGRWSAASGWEPATVAEHPAHAGYVEVSADPLAEPRVARLHGLLAGVLADWERVEGSPHPQAAELEAALADVAFIPEEARRWATGAARAARSDAIRRERLGR